MSRERLQTRCDPDTLQEVEEYATDKEISQSEAVRRLVRTGLVQKGYREAETGDYATAHMNERARQAGTILMLLALGFLAAVAAGLL